MINLYWVKDEIGGILFLHCDRFREDCLLTINVNFELHFRFSLKLGQIVETAVYPNFVAFGDDWRDFEVKEEILSGDGIDENLSDEGIDRAPSCGKSPLRRFRWHRDIHGCHTRIVRDHRTNPVACVC